MKYQLIKDLTIKTGAGEMLLKEGQVISLSDDKASQLIQAGYAVLSDAYEERAAIMEFDGGLDRAEAEKLSWCREICMLTKGQAVLCEKNQPCPKYQ